MYHGRILLPSAYPMKPPNIIFMNKNGRFEVGTKICLSISAYHEESWQPAWGIRTMLEAIISFFPSEGSGAIGALDYPKEERQKLAVESRSYCCPCCGPICELLTTETDDENPDQDIVSQISQLKFSGTEESPIKNQTTPISEEKILDSTKVPENQALELKFQTPTKSVSEAEILFEDEVEKSCSSHETVIENKDNDMGLQIQSQFSSNGIRRRIAVDQQHLDITRQREQEIPQFVNSTPNNTYPPFSFANYMILVAIIIISLLITTIISSKVFRYIATTL